MLSDLSGYDTYGEEGATVADELWLSALPDDQQRSVRRLQYLAYVTGLNEGARDAFDASDASRRSIERQLAERDADLAALVPLAKHGRKAYNLLPSDELTEENFPLSCAALARVEARQ